MNQDLSNAYNFHSPTNKFLTRKAKKFYGLLRIAYFAGSGETDKEPSPRRHIYADQDSTNGCPAVLRNMGGRTGCGLHEHKSDSTKFSNQYESDTKFSNQHDNNADHHDDHASTDTIDQYALDFNCRAEFNDCQSCDTKRSDRVHEQPE